MEHEISGTIFGGVGVTSIVSIFIYGTRASKKTDADSEESSELDRSSSDRIG